MTRLASLAIAVLAALLVAGEPAQLDVADAGGEAEVVVALASPPLAKAPARGAQVDAEQRAFRAELAARLPDARVHWHYRLVVNGFSVTLPRAQFEDLREISGVRHVYESASYEPQLNRSPGQIGAPTLWGPTLATAGQGMKIGIIDTGVDASHPFFDPSGYSMPPGFPKGQTRFTTAKVIVARAFAPPGTEVPGADLAFDGPESSHGTHVAGVAAGNAGTQASGGRIVSGVAPRAYIGNYKVFTRSDSRGGPIENAAELVAAIEAAVRDGMNVINLSLGEPEIEPSRNIVTLAIDAAAAAGVVPVVAAGNEYNEVGAGSVSSPATSARAIAVAAVETSGTPPKSVHAYFSSVGPTPISLLLKPDVAAPGVDILSSVPDDDWASFDGTSSASPHVAGAAALLKQRHPEWTVDEIKSALVQSGTDATDEDGAALGPQFLGGGVVALAKADRPLVFAEPTAISLGLLARGSNSGGTVELEDAGDGVGTWQVTEVRAPGSRGRATLLVPATVEVPGELQYDVVVPSGAAAADLAGYIELRRGADVRRVPFFGRVTAAALGRHSAIPLATPGVHAGTTRGKRALVSRYRYPDDPSRIAVTTLLAGPEAVYRVRIARRVANFGVVVTRRAPEVRVEPRIVAGEDENRLTGVAALPVTRNPYLKNGFYTRTLAAAALSPAPSVYSVVFDSATAKGAGRFRFRFWVNDTTPPTLRFRTRSVVSGQAVTVAATDAGSGVSPNHVFAFVDGQPAPTSFRNGQARVGTQGLAVGIHRLRLQVSDYQETKNTENVARILPNTKVLTTTFRVRER